MEDTPDTSVSDADISQAPSLASSGDPSEASPAFQPAPAVAGATAKVDHIFARVALDYRRWWEIADVLINLADGAEDQTDDTSLLAGSSTDSPGRRGRCVSEMPMRTSASTSLLSNLSRDGSPSSKLGQPDASLVPSIPAIPSVKTALDTSQDVSTPPTLLAPATASVAALTRLHPVSPTLTRSYSASSFSPSTSASDGHCAGGGSREIVGIEGNSMSVSDRQLDILRAMLKPRSPVQTISPLSATDEISLQSTPTKAMPGGHAADGSSGMAEATTPAPSPLARRSTFRNWKPSLTPERRMPTSLSAPTGLSSQQTAPPQLVLANDMTAADQSVLSIATATTLPDSDVSMSSAAQSVTGRARSKSKSRLRQVSRAGMLGIRDFLKALKRSGVNITFEPAPAVPALPVQPHGPAEKGTLPLLSTGNTLSRRVVSHTQVISSTSSKLCEHSTPVKNSLLGTTMLAAAATVDSPSGSSSDEEEDWDRHSSEESDEEVDAIDAVSTEGASPSRILRSDTQATILASAQDRAAAGTGALAHTRPALAGRRRSTLRAKKRGRTYSTNSTAPLPASGAGLSTGTWHLGGKLVMTTEAMPTLLAKIDEVRMHCASCVTELRCVSAGPVISKREELTVPLFHSHRNVTV